MDWIEISVKNAALPIFLSFLTTGITLFISYRQGKKKQKTDDFTALTETGMGLISSLQKERVDLVAERTELKSEIKQLRERITELESENTKLKKQVDGLQSQNDNFAKEIEKIKKRL